MAKLSLRIDDNLLEKARRLATRRNTSIDAILEEKLEELVSSDLKCEAILKDIEGFFERRKAQVGEKTWNRDEIHER